MIVATRGGGMAEVRAAEFGSSAIPAPGMGGAAAWAGYSVTADRATALPAVSAAIRLVADTVGVLPMVVYSGDGPVRDRATASWQYRLLHENPAEGTTAFDFWSDVAANVEGYGNAYAQKIKSRGRVVELRLLDPTAVDVSLDRDTGEKQFKVRLRGGTQTFTAADVLQFRGPTIRGGVKGLSPIEQHRRALGVGLALDDFMESYFENGTIISGVIQVPTNMTRAGARELLEVWSGDHGGTPNAHKPAILYNGATWNPLGVSLQDAQFVESQRFTIEEIARIFRVPAVLLGAGGTRESGITTEQESLRFLQFSLQPRLRRIEAALVADPDLFGAGSLIPRFDTAELMRVDWATQWNGYHLAVQDGTLLKDEVRAVFGYGPLPGGVGAVPQQTPVGGAPNESDPVASGPEQPQDAPTAP